MCFLPNRPLGVLILVNSVTVTSTLLDSLVRIVIVSAFADTTYPSIFTVCPVPTQTPADTPKKTNKRQVAIRRMLARMTHSCFTSLCVAVPVGRFLFIMCAPVLGDLPLRAFDKWLAESIFDSSDF